MTTSSWITCEISKDLLDHQRFYGLYDLPEVVTISEGDHESQVFSFRHQPEPHLRHNAKIGLNEYAISVWTVSVPESLPCWIICAIGTWQCSHSGSENFFVWQKDLVYKYQYVVFTRY